MTDHDHDHDLERLRPAMTAALAEMAPNVDRDEAWARIAHTTSSPKSWWRGLAAVAALIVLAGTAAIALPGDGVDPVSVIAGVDGEITTYRFEISSIADGAPFGSLGGSVDLVSGDSQFESIFSFDDGEAFGFEFLLVDGVGYTRDLGPGQNGRWRHAPDDPDFDVPAGHDSFPLGPTDLSDIIDSRADDAVTVGTEDIRGVPTTHYRLEASSAESLGIDLPPPDDDDDAEVEFEVGNAGIEIDAWIDDQGRTRQAILTFTTVISSPEFPDPMSISNEQHLEYWDYGVPLDLEAPPASEIEGD